MSAPKRFFWMKLKESFMTSDTIDYFMEQPNGANYVVLYQMLCLKTINTQGRLSRQIGEIIIPYDVEKIRRDLKWFNADTIRVALELYKAVGLIYEDVDGTLVLTDHQSLVGSETDSAVRMRNSRRSGSLPPSKSGVTDGAQCAQIVTPDIEIDIEIDKEKEKELDIHSTSPGKVQQKKGGTGGKEKADAFSEFAGSDPDLLAALMDFEEMRKASKKPMTDRAKKLLVNKLGREFPPEVWIAVLEQSISHNWADVYPLKDQAQPGKYRQQGRSRSEDAMEALGQLHEMFEEEGQG